MRVPELQQGKGGSMKCRREKCPNRARQGKNQGYCLKHYDLITSRGFVDAQPVRERLHLLRERGWGWRELSEQVGLTGNGLRLILIGKSPTVRVVTRDAVMAIPVPECVVARGAQVSVVGTRRRVQALAVMGWSQRDIAARAGIYQNLLSRAINHDTILASNAAAVAKVFDELHMRQGPSKSARARARNKGWFPPLAWDLESIDDPNAQPSCGESRQVLFTEKLAELEYMNIPRSEMPTWLGIEPDSFERNLSRMKERELKEAV